MASVLLGMNGQPVHSARPVADNHHRDYQPASKPDWLSESEWDCGPGGPLGFFERVPGLWVVVHGITGQVVGCAESRNDALFLIGERHANCYRVQREHARRREAAQENYERKIGTW